MIQIKDNNKNNKIILKLKDNNKNNNILIKNELYKIEEGFFLLI